MGLRCHGLGEHKGRETGLIDITAHVPSPRPPVRAKRHAGRWSSASAVDAEPEVSVTPELVTA